MDDNIPGWDSFALLLVDVQNDFWPREFAQQFPQFPENTARLLQFCRAEGTEGVEVLPFAQPMPGEKVIVKHAFDGFQAPELLPYLRQTKKRFVLVSGLVTSTCVFFTTVSAMQNGFLTAIVEDCCADDDDRHEYTLDAYPFIFNRTSTALISSHQEQWLAGLRALAAVEESLAASSF